MCDVVSCSCTWSYRIWEDEVNRTFGWTGKILRVDLTERKSFVESSERYVERFLGGIGIGLRVFWEEVGPHVGAFDPDNLLVFAPGPLTGSLAPASGRFEIVSKSPHNYPLETVTRSGVGGFWGPELKYAGYDALIVQGQADDWVTLWICDDQVVFRNAKEYVGEDTYATQTKLRKELDPRAKILCIGPAGENLSRLAVIVSETSFVSGKSGFGAVMGSKKLKAIAVRGTQSLNIADPDRLVRISREVRELSARDPMREWTSRTFVNREYQREFLNKYRKQNTSCFACHMACFAYLRVPDSGESQAHCLNYYYLPPATKYYGHTLERDQAVSDSYVLANRLGLDTTNIGGMIKFLNDLYRAGRIGPEPELPVDKVGSREFIQKLLFAIAYRKGIGDLLSEGAPRAADHIKEGWESCSKYFPAHGAAEHEPLRNYPGIALLWALDSRDPVVDHHQYVHLGIKYQQAYPEPYKLASEHAKRIAAEVFGSERAIDHSSFDYKPEAVLHAQNRSMVINLLVLCDWIYPIVQSQMTKDRSGNTSFESQLLSAVTGYHLTEEELSHVGERIWNLARAIMILEGRSRERDSLHESFFRERDGERAIPKQDFEHAKTKYYQLRGWDEQNGWPTVKKLTELGLSDVARKLQETVALKDS
jgi:aldehyde:ferredoxin oxidoreductase